MTTRKLIKVDGTEIDLPGPISSVDIRILIGAPEGLDTVSLHHMGEPLLVMLVDDESYEIETVNLGGGHFELRPIKALRPVNVKATELYLKNCLPGTTHQILGDVVIVPDDDFA